MLHLKGPFNRIIDLNFGTCTSILPESSEVWLIIVKGEIDVVETHFAYRI